MSLGCSFRPVNYEKWRMVTAIETEKAKVSLSVFFHEVVYCISSKTLHVFGHEPSWTPKYNVGTGVSLPGCRLSFNFHYFSPSPFML